ncbi:MAG TPA: hypothetical protein VNT75_04180 [Symbiobacteriaceae bacterium]|nr:hypothetical protein [Symbiobacteriaceae bacterium]
MTHFLEVGSMRDGLAEIRENAQWLWRLLSMSPDQRLALEQSRIQQGDMTTHADDVRKALLAVLEEADSMISFLDQFESAPIIYTGEGSTAEVLARLERLVERAGESK